MCVGCVPPLIPCWVQATVNCLCLVFGWQAYPIRNMAWLLYPGSLADLTSALTGAADSLRWGVYHLYYRLPSPLLIPGGQANSSLQGFQKGSFRMEWHLTECHPISSDIWLKRLIEKFQLMDLSITRS